MHSITGAPFTAAVLSTLTMLVSGCVAYDAARTVAGTGVAVISATGDIVTVPFEGDGSEKK